MISIIISNNDIKALAGLKKSILETIGVGYELIIINNNNGEMSISSAMNQGANRANFEYLCWVHEDVVFTRQNWGNILINLLREPCIGVIGIAGGIYKSINFSPAWFNFRHNAHRVNIVQPNAKNELEQWIENPNKESLSEVVVVDGVFMCCRKSVWEQYNFDENVIRGFHFYDMDFCLGVRSLGYKNYVTHEIFLEHYSSGKNNLDWYKHGKRVHQKWEHTLPQFVGEMTDKEIRQVEYQTLEYAFNLQLKLRALGDAFISMCQLIWQRPLKGQNLLYLKNWMKQLVYAA